MRGDDAANDRHPHRYSAKRLEDALEWLAARPGTIGRICDLGCGTGTALASLATSNPEAALIGVDVSDAALSEAEQAADCTTVRASVLAPDLGDRVGGPCDAVLLAAVVHHVIGPTRRASRSAATAAIRNALSLLAPDGALIVVEPTFGPAWAMTLVFWVKRCVGALTTRRVELGRWNNLGAPVVSYYGADEVAEMIGRAGGRVVEAIHRPLPVRRLPRLLGVAVRHESTYVVRPGPPLREAPGRTGRSRRR